MKPIPFKAVAVDMDGTFENDQREYDHQKFAKIMKQLQSLKISFIAASGRPISRLVKDFSGFDNKIGIVADNGGALASNGKVINTHCFLKSSVKALIKIIQTDFPTALPVTLVSGIKHTYCLNTIPEKRRKMMLFYYPNTTTIDNFDNLPDDQYTKVTISYPNTIGKKIEELYNQAAKQKIKFTTSGFENIDLVPAGTDKASGLTELLKYLHVRPNETIVFGDSGNDIEMLKLTPYSYVMSNGALEAKKVARFEAPSNNDQGVFKILDSCLIKN